MPVFLAPLFTKLFWGALFGRAKTNAVNDWRALSPKARIYIVCTVAAVLLFFIHQHVAKVKLHNQYKDGYAQAQKDDDEKLKSANAQIEALNVAIAADERKKNDAQAAAIGTHADAVRLRGPGKAVCPGIPAAPGRPESGSGTVSAGLDRLPYPQWQQLIGVPFDDSVGFAKQCDINAAEVRAWHSWYNRLAAAWPKAVAAR